MREFAKINPALWTSKKFKSLQPDVQRVYFYLLTNPHSESVGCFHLPRGYIMTDLEMGRIELNNALGQCETSRLIETDIDEDLFYINNWVDEWGATSPNHAMQQVKDLRPLPTSRLKIRACEDALRLFDAKGWIAASDLLKGLIEQETGLLKPLASPSEGFQHLDSYLNPHLDSDSNLKKGRDLFSKNDSGGGEAAIAGAFTQPQEQFGGTVITTVMAHRDLKPGDPVRIDPKTIDQNGTAYTADVGGNHELTPEEFVKAVAVEFQVPERLLYGKPRTMVIDGTGKVFGVEQGQVWADDWREFNGEAEGRDLDEWKRKADGVPRETPPSPQIETIEKKEKGETHLWEFFPKCTTPDDFADGLPKTWQAVVAKFITADDIADWPRIFCLGFWEKYVGAYPEDPACAEKFQTKANWFRCFELAAENQARTAQGLPPRKVFGKKAAAAAMGRK